MTDFQNFQAAQGSRIAKQRFELKSLCNSLCTCKLLQTQSNPLTPTTSANPVHDVRNTLQRCWRLLDGLQWGAVDIQINPFIQHGTVRFHVNADSDAATHTVTVTQLHHAIAVHAVHSYRLIFIALGQDILE